MRCPHCGKLDDDVTLRGYCLHCREEPDAPRKKGGAISKKAGGVRVPPAVITFLSVVLVVGVCGVGIALLAEMKPERGQRQTPREALEQSMKERDQQIKKEVEAAVRARPLDEAERRDEAVLDAFVREYQFEKRKFVPASRRGEKNSGELKVDEWSFRRDGVIN